MKAIILAGGLGTRLGNRTTLTPKPLVKIGNKPVLWHIMKIYSYYGITDFIICLGYKGDAIKDYFTHYETKNNDFTINLGSSKITYHNEHQEKDWNITLVDTGVNTLKGGRIKQIERFLTDEINFVTYGDGVANIDIKQLLEFHKEHGKIITITGVHPPARFGELLENNNLLVSFQEKPQTSKGLINGGFMVFNRELLNYLTPDEDCDFEIGPLENLSKEGKVMVYKHQGQWECMDHERDVVHLNKLWNENIAFWKIW